MQKRICYILSRLCFDILHNYLRLLCGLQLWLVVTYDPCPPGGGGIFVATPWEQKCCLTPNHFVSAPFSTSLLFSYPSLGCKKKVQAIARNLQVLLVKAIETMRLCQICYSKKGHFINKMIVSKHFFPCWPSRAQPKAAKAFTPEFRLPLPSIEPLFISSNHTLPLFHPSRPPLSRWQFVK